ncbi:MAG TPA: hypothetical protein VE868_05100 [Balneolaceae bacterium]|nr:hypothetical protein [Balneolaceae bacterium]
MKKIIIVFLLLQGAGCSAVFGQSSKHKVPEKVMRQIYKKVKTPYKYGLVIVPPKNSKKVDCPTVYRMNGKWFMTYIVYNGRGYETWLATSQDLLHWKTLGRLLSFSKQSDWDADQKAGYIALEDYQWGESYHVRKYDGKYWMSYFGGHTKGYEKGTLSLGMAYTSKKPDRAFEWNRLKKPILKPTDKSASWWDNQELYKSMVIWDRQQTTGYPFVMFYNARGDSTNSKKGEAERIGMAVSKDMVHWKRLGKNPILDHHTGITGDPDIQKIGNVWVMFYYGAFWPHTSGAFDRFACSYDLRHWTDWDGPDLIKPSKSYDAEFAHKPFVLKYKGVVYHFYCAVNKYSQRGIAVATSRDMGKSKLHFKKHPSKSNNDN